MRVQKIIEQLDLDAIHLADPSREITGGYASDLLSCVMAGAKTGNVWVTLQAHPNVIAVASLVELAAVIVTEGITADPETVNKAQQAGINLLATPRTTFTVVSELARLGIEGTGPG